MQFFIPGNQHGLSYIRIPHDRASFHVSSFPAGTPRDDRTREFLKLGRQNLKTSVIPPINYFGRLQHFTEIKNNIFGSRKF